MAATYKNTGTHRTRQMETEEVFVRGMKYTNTPHDPGYAKTIVNFNIKNDGEVFAPRGGLRVVRSEVTRQLLDTDIHSDYCVHHTHMMYVKTESSDAILCHYILASTIDSSEQFLLKNAKLIIELNNDYLEATYDDAASTAALLMQPACTAMHEMPIHSPKKRSGIFTSLEGNTYVLFQKSDTGKYFLGRIEATLSSSNTLSWTVVTITPTEVQPTQAINYGYNMLKENPYTFSNVSTATGDIVLTGVVPYDEQGKLLLTARPGTTIDFKLYYKYPSSDSGDKYLIQWEVQDLSTGADPVVVQRVRKSKEYTPGNEIVFKYTPAFTSFALIAKMYRKTEIAASDAEWTANANLQQVITKDDYLKPSQVTTLSSYHLTANSSSSTLNVDAASFNIGTAKGMCTWQQRVVFWGVDGARSTLFVSEINDPGYVPYPNNSEIFHDNIICAVPYMTYLLVFTKSSLYKLTLNDDGVSYSTTCVQERLGMIEEDANTVITVQNMVYFKSNNYFYMIVPNNKSLQTDLQMAPVSRPIEYLLNDFEKGLKDIVNAVYNLTYTTSDEVFSVELLDYYVHVADTQIRNTYKLRITKDKSYYVDVSLNYDTVLRAWTCYLYETTPYRMVVYKPTVTGQTQFAHIRELFHTARVSIAVFDEEEPQDNLPLDEDADRTFGNYQYLDTGYRGFSTEYKKRFREVQFHINSRTECVLNFYTSFVVDDVETQPMYKNTITQVTDKNDPNYGVIFVERELIDVKNTPMLTRLDEWELDTSQFPELTVYKIRYRVSGKGYGGAVRLLSVNESNYELLNMSWVYRLMFAR